MTEPVTFAASRAAYIRTHWIMAAAAMVFGMAVLWIMGNPHVWTGAVGGLAAVALRGWYLMDEELGHRWDMRDGVLHGPAERHIPLSEIAQVKVIGAATQIITRGGDKHLIKFQSDPQATRARIEAALPRQDA